MGEAGRRRWGRFAGVETMVLVDAGADLRWRGVETTVREGCW